MIYTSENNWYYWQYNNGPKFGRKQVGDVFTTSFTPFLGKVGTFKEELTKAAKSTLDTYQGLKPSIYFSGGIDSEIMLRSYLEIKANPDVYIVRYEKDYNLYDVSYAVTVCSLLNVDYKIIDFNLEKFFNNDAERISELSQSDRPRALIYSKFIEDSEGLPILGTSTPPIFRLNENYNEKGEWVLTCLEHAVAWSKFSLTINKPAVAEWFKWTPGLVLSFLNLDWCKNLVNDRYYGKLGVNSTKILGYREAYTDIIDRKKKSGFEKIDHLVNEFEEYLSKKNNGLHFRDSFSRPISQLELEIKGIYKKE